MTPSTPSSVLVGAKYDMIKNMISNIRSGGYKPGVRDVCGVMMDTSNEGSKESKVPNRNNGSKTTSRLVNILPTASTDPTNTGNGVVDGTGVNTSDISESCYNTRFQTCTINQKRPCGECDVGYMTQDYRKGISECTSCGYMEDDVSISSNQSGCVWSEISSDMDSGNKYGLPTNPLLPISSMGTLMGGGGGVNYNGVRRIHGWTTMPYHERSLYEIFRQISSMTGGSETHVFNMIISDTKLYYKKIHDKGDNYVLTRGKMRKGVIAACFLYACNQRKIARTELDVAMLFKIDLKILTKGTKKFREIMWKKGYKVYFDPISPLVYIERFCNMLGIRSEHSDIAKFIAYRCSKLNITDSNTPLSITGGCIHSVNMLYGYSIELSEIQKITSVGVGTITTFYKTVLCYLEYILPKRVLLNTVIVKGILLKSMNSSIEKVGENVDTEDSDCECYYGKMCSDYMDCILMYY